MISNSRVSVATIAGATLSVIASYWAYQSLSEYGLDGTLRYIWEGDPYTSTVREYLNILELAEKSRATQCSRMNAIEEALERARLDSVDDARMSKDIIVLWTAYYLPQNLEKSLAELSHVLDRLAAEVDGILLSSRDVVASSHVLQTLRKKKKLLSKQLVLDMERCDALMASYDILRET